MIGRHIEHNCLLQYAFGDLHSHNLEVVGRANHFGRQLHVAIEKVAVDIGVVLDLNGIINADQDLSVLFILLHSVMANNYFILYLFYLTYCLFL